MIIHAIQLAERLSPADQEQFVTTLQDLSIEKTTSFDMAMTLAASLGQFQGDTALEMLQTVLQNWSQKPLLNKLALSGLYNKDQAFISRLTGSPLHKKLTKLMAQKRPPSNVKPTHLTESEYLTYLHGKKRFETRAGCSGCHGYDGMGLEFAGPPLAGSEWVTGNPGRLAALLIHGLNGPIHVGGTLYEPEMEMPGLKDSKHFSMSDIAALLAYIRNSWGNEGSLPTIEEMNKIKAQTKDRKTPYTEKELLEEFTKP